MATEKEKARKMYLDGVSIADIASTTGRQYGNVYRDCEDLMQPCAIKSVNPEAFSAEWNQARYPFLCLKIQRDARKERGAMIRFNVWRNIALQSLVDTLARLSDEELQKIGFYRKNDDKRMETRRSELIEWLMEEI